MKFHKLSIKISKELCINRDDRATNVNTFVQDVFNEYNDILEKSGCVDKVLKDYLQLEKIICVSSESLKLGLRSIKYIIVTQGILLLKTYLWHHLF